MAKKAAKKRAVTKKPKGGQSRGVIAAEIGAGVLAAGAAAAAGYYFYGDKKAKKHRQAASKWAKGLKNQVVKEAKTLSKMSEKDMAKIVDRAAAVYAGVRAVNQDDLKRAANELKRNWKHVQAEVAAVRAKRAPKKAAKKSVKKAVKKAAKKSTAKRR